MPRKKRTSKAIVIKDEFEEKPNGRSKKKRVEPPPPDLDFERCWRQPFALFKNEVERLGREVGASEEQKLRLMTNCRDECQRTIMRITEKNRRELCQYVTGKENLRKFKATFSEDEEDPIDIKEFFGD